jgi:asparaginyl-tRNA synthetase
MSIQVLQEVKNRFAILNSSQALALDQINDALMWGARDYFRQQGFTWIDVPTITKITGACENVDTLYALDHFGEEAYLAQTGQLYLETKIPGHKKVWTIIQSNRAEARADARHLNQFQLVEFEEEGDFEQLLTRIEGTVKAMMEATLEQKEAYALLERNPKEVEAWVKEPFGRITYTEAIEMLKGTPHEQAWGADLSHEEEQFLVKAMGWKPLFITNYPTEIKFFNMRQVPGKDEIVNSADLLLPYAGESVGSAERRMTTTSLLRGCKTARCSRSSLPEERRSTISRNTSTSSRRTLCSTLAAASASRASHRAFSACPTSAWRPPTPSPVKRCINYND